MIVRVSLTVRVSLVVRVPTDVPSLSVVVHVVVPVSIVSAVTVGVTVASDIRTMIVGGILVVIVIVTGAGRVMPVPARGRRRLPYGTALLSHAALVLSLDPVSGP